MAPDASMVDWYDPVAVQEYHAQHDTYVQGVARQAAQSAMAPHMDALREAALHRDYNAAVARYGQDENFKECMAVALENCAEADKAGKPFDIVTEYQKANDKTAARPGQRGNAHLPQAFQDKRRGISMLGRIMEHNRQTGRANFQRKGW